MVESLPDAIGEDEAALYDRQIRLWGLDAQNRLRNASVLLVGLSGVGAEVAKNLMLCGLKRLTLMDDKEVTECDASNQFLAPPDSLGQNRAAASVDRCRALNPLVDLRVLEGGLDGAALEGCDLACVCDGGETDLLRAAALCRKVGVHFVGGAVRGRYGMAAFDFGCHEFAREIRQPAVADPSAVVDVDGGGEPESKRAKLAETAANLTKGVVDFGSIHSAFDVDWGTKQLLGRVRRLLPDAYLVMRALLRFQDQTGHRFGAEESDLEKMAPVWKEVIGHHRLSDECKVQLTDLKKYGEGALSPVCAIVGGVMSQEIIKALSQRDEPLNNVFVYDGMEGTGSVCQLPPPPPPQR